MAAELAVLEVLLGAGVVLYGADPRPWDCWPPCLAATVAVASTGTLYGALVSGLRVRETCTHLRSCPCWRRC